MSHTLNNTRYPLVGLPRKGIGDTVNFRSGFIGRSYRGKWYVHDWVGNLTETCDFVTRHGMLTAWVSHHKPEGIYVMPYTWLDNPDAAFAFYRQCVAEGHAGAIFYIPGAIAEGEQDLIAVL